MIAFRYEQLAIINLDWCGICQLYHREEDHVIAEAVEVVQEGSSGQGAAPSQPEDEHDPEPASEP
jgi:hypothetical protein